MENNETYKLPMFELSDYKIQMKLIGCRYRNKRQMEYNLHLLAVTAGFLLSIPLTKLLFDFYIDPKVRNIMFLATAIPAAVFWLVRYYQPADVTLHGAAKRPLDDPSKIYLRFSQGAFVLEYDDLSVPFSFDESFKLKVSEIREGVFRLVCHATNDLQEQLEYALECNRIVGFRRINKTLSFEFHMDSESAASFREVFLSSAGSDKHEK